MYGIIIYYKITLTIALTARGESMAEKWDFEKKFEKKKGDSAETSPSADDFWDISRWVPEKKRPAPPLISHPSHTEAVEMELPDLPGSSPSAPPAAEPPISAQKISSDPTAVVGVTHFVPPHTPEETSGGTPADTYTPDGAFLHRVRVYDWPSGYHYFDQFIKDAEYYATQHGRKTTPEPFFSYFPQYVQLNRRQLAWYLWWRDAAREGCYAATDYAYVLLYIFELLNLPSPPGSTEGRDALAAVWMAYRSTYRQLDHYMCEWLCDYCLIHHLSAPVNILAPALDDIVRESRLKEFYLSAAITAQDGKDDLATAQILLRHACHYDYRKSKFATGEHKAMFDRIIPAAVAAVVPMLTDRSHGKPLVTLQESMATRDAYVGALCAYRNKCRIEVDYTSFSRSHELRFLIGDMVKHIENRLRGRIGVRSRLSTMSLPIPLRDALDAYLRTHLPDERPAVAPSKKVTPVPDYEKRYDLPRKAVSLADADAIEQASWDTTRILTEAFAEDPMPNRPVVPPVPPDLLPQEPPPSRAVPSADAPEDAPATSSLAAALGNDRLTFLRLCLDGDRAGQRAFCRERRKMPDALADEINQITVETDIFDAVLEDGGDGSFVVAEDYRDAVTRAVTSTTAETL